MADPTPTDLFDLFDQTPVHRLLGLRLEHRDSRAARVSLPLRPELTQEKGVVHGGVITTLADTAAVYVLLPELDAMQELASIEFKMSFLRPAVLAGGPLTAQATLIKSGRRVAFLEVAVSQGDRAIARGSFSYLVG
jgi:uncharacterized protein (TIGR00369 family)